MESTKNPPAITVRDLRIRRGSRDVFTGLDCEVESGKITGILGPSGSGKTTLLRAVVGVQKQQSGRITVLDLPAGHPQLRHVVAYMTQAVSVYRDLTVLQNIRYFASLYGQSDSGVRRVISEVGLHGYGNQLAGELSGGQMSRVSLACCLISDPGVMVLDEPTVGQDPVLREELWENFRARAARGTTVIVSSHVMDEAARCDDLILMREGQIIAQDHPENLLDKTGAETFEDAFLTLIRSENETR